MSTNREKVISFRDAQEIIDSLDVIALAKGIDRSDVLRMLIREKLAADSADAEKKSAR